MISVEPQIFTIRGGAEHEKFGDPYTFVVTAVKDGEDSIRFVGLVGKPTLREFKKIRDYFISIGIIKADWERAGTENKKVYIAKD